MPSITPCLWFDNNLEEAAQFYTSVFPNSTIETLERYTEAGPGTPGDVVWGAFVLDGTRFMGINGGARLSFSGPASLLVERTGPDQVRYYWGKLRGAGAEAPRRGLHGRLAV